MIMRVLLYFLTKKFFSQDASHNNIGHHAEYWHALRRFALKARYTQPTFAFLYQPVSTCINRMFADDYGRPWRPSFLHAFRFSLTALCHQLVQSRPQKHSTGVGSVLSMKWDQIRYGMISSQHIEYHWIISESYLNRIELYWIWIHRFHSESHRIAWQMVNQLCRQALEHLCAVCAQKAASKCGVKPSPGLSRGVQGLRSTRSQHKFNQSQDMSRHVTWNHLIQNIRDMQTESNWYQLVN